MKTMTYSESRARYAETSDSVINDREEVVITRAGRDPVVIVALDDYQSLKEAPTCCAAPRTPAGCWRRSIVLNTAAGPLASCWIPQTDEVRLGRARLGRLPVVAGPGPEGPQRINTLLQEVVRNRNEGIGKPEPLKHGFHGYWSRRITDEHRLVYKIVDDGVRIAACRYHYGD